MDGSNKSSSFDENNDSGLPIKVPRYSENSHFTYEMPILPVHNHSMNYMDQDDSTEVMASQISHIFKKLDVASTSLSEVTTKPGEDLSIPSCGSESSSQSNTTTKENVQNNNGQTPSTTLDQRTYHQLSHNSNYQLTELFNTIPNGITENQNEPEPSTSLDPRTHPQLSDSFHLYRSESLNNSEILVDRKETSNCNAEDSRHSRHTKMRDLLGSSTDGRMVLALYDSKNHLDGAARSLLTRTIIKMEADIAMKLVNFQTLQQFSISTSKFQSLSAEIVETFPTEVTATYFTPFSRISGQSINQTGKLWDGYNNYKRILRKNGLLKPSNRGRLEKTVEPTADDSETLLKLRTAVEPWSDIMKMWAETFAARRKVLSSTLISVEQYFQNYACLSLKQANDLFEYDFSILHPDSANLFRKIWAVSRPFLVEKLKNTKISDPEDMRYLSILSLILPERQDPFLFWLLPYIIPYGRMKRKKSDLGTGPAKKLSFTETRNSFVLKIESVIPIEIALTTAKKTLSDLHLTQQPVPVFVGPLENVAAFYVIFNNRAYEVGSAVEAIAMTTQICFSVDCQYPPDAKLIWVFLQKAFFGIDLKEKVPLKMTTLIGEIQALGV